MKNSRRDFIKKTTIGATAISIGGVASGMSARSYKRIIGANERLQVVFWGCGRRVSGYYNAVMDESNNIDLAYICDVMKSQREKTASEVSGKISGNATLINDIRTALEDPDVDAVFNATPDHWHAPGAWMAMSSGKHVYLEKPITHNPREGELLLHFQKKYGKIVQVGTQQRSSPETNEIIHKIHNGIIGNAYEAIAFYSNYRGETPVPHKAPAPEGLDWELFQGPAPHQDYVDNVWDYNWHWYGWNWGTAEAGNNGTHEMDIARWALQVKYPEYVDVKAEKRHFLNDGWEMYDTMDVTFDFNNKKKIKWEGRSRNGYGTYGEGRGTIVFGTDGSVFINRNGYKHYDRNGKLVSDSKSEKKEAGIALGGGGHITDIHIKNFFDNIREKSDTLNAPVEKLNYSHMLVHYANIGYRTGKPLKINQENGHIYNKEAMRLWKREYQKGYEPNLD